MTPASRAARPASLVAAAGRRPAFLAPALAAAILALGSCATKGPAPELPPPPAPTAGSAGAAGAAGAAGTAGRPLPSPGLAPAPAVRPPSPFLARALAATSSKTYENGATLLARRLSGRSVAAAEIVLAGSGSAVPKGKDGIEALALALAARGGTAAAGSIPRLVGASGGSLEIKALSYDAVGLELVAPRESFLPLLEAVLAALAEPGFAESDYLAVMRDFRVAELKASGDPLLLAAKRLRAELYRGHPYALAPLGTGGSLLALGRDEVAAYYKKSVGSERLALVIAGDFAWSELEPRLGGALERLPRRGPGAAPLPVVAWERKELAEDLPGPALAYLRADFAAPPAASPDFAALEVALAMLDDLLAEGLRGSSPLAYGAWSRLSGAAFPSGSLVAERAGDPAAARAAMLSAVEVLRSGRCLAIGRNGGGLAPLGESLEAYKARAVARLYGRADGAADIALRMARDLAAGGDGSGFVRLADRLAAVGAEEVLRVARERLDPAGFAWSLVY